MLDYQVISSGSQEGNCFRVENVLIDLGVKFNDLENIIINQKIKAIFISHKHGDHFNHATYNQITKRFPYIKFIVNDQIAKIMQNIHSNKNVLTVVDNATVKIPSNDKKDYLSLVIKVFHTDHELNLQSNGYYGEKIGYNLNNENFVYATDFWNEQNLPSKKLDYIFLEANYDKKVLNKAINELNLPKWSIRGSGRHFPKEKSFQYYVTHRKTKDSVYVPLHKSSRFYEDYGNLDLNDDKHFEHNHFSAPAFNQSHQTYQGTDDWDYWDDEPQISVDEDIEF